ncbi:hypothetical protein GGR54DRAFT_444351 [Hypoxylon sp. NC1633]|nr:hypothetical protein GGR54DRAFT_444351 [Hypoxylon sp. NC1633]
MCVLELEIRMYRYVPKGKEKEEKKNGADQPADCIRSRVPGQLINHDESNGENSVSGRHEHITTNYMLPAIEISSRIDTNVPPARRRRHIPGVYLLLPLQRSNVGNLSSLTPTSIISTPQKVVRPRSTSTASSISVIALTARYIPSPAREDTSSRASPCHMSEGCVGTERYTLHYIYHQLRFELLKPRRLFNLYSPSNEL